MVRTIQTARTTTKPKLLKRKHPLIVVLLQCIPLLGAAGCASMGATNQASSGTACLLWISVLFWGLGYAYLGRIYRSLIVGLIGPVFAFASCIYSAQGSGFDFEHQRVYGDVGSANLASLQEALIITAAVVLLTVDALRLTAAHNAKAVELTSDQ